MTKSYKVTKVDSQTEEERDYGINNYETMKLITRGYTKR